ncbi:MAG TPA: NAD-glutamate dehydrogenase, partial [Hellea balneolensis]|nr:NAD-glutamate dehydrogenase [Hellea balneolensis]
GCEYWVHDYEMRLGFTPKEAGKLARIFETAFLAIWNGQNEDDQFNALILPQSVDWRKVAFLRLMARYRKQSGLDPSENVQIEALARYPDITHHLLDLFSVKFDPALNLTMDARKAKASQLVDTIKKELETVVSLDHDRVLRRLLNTLDAALRTNYFKVDEEGQPQPFMSLKVNSQAIEPLPAPKPYREIFVWSPRVEGIHLRFGPVARGGLRWSDRRDDFRTEVLGLVKAQQVKNAVIVPVGSKGGFYPKQLPKTGGRDAFMAEGIAAYTEFVSGLLDITDTYEGKGTKAPDSVVCWDDPDPYLVVAADKGTATFSDIANGIAEKYGFWLGDAFASGGSVGYDHKAMGITARGGWEAVKRHFREMGKDIQSEDFDVIGVGDMSGDVFGNGMLLSKHIRLLAAFDHRDVFIDPDPDPKSTFSERKRLFETPGTTWQDFDKKLISKGGGVYSRSAKSIELTPEIKKLTGLSDDNVTPNALIHALLKAPCELLWFGGIGTYIKGRTQSHSDVSDKANDAIRVNGNELKAKVIG